jgi:hypothetical protein
MTDTHRTNLGFSLLCIHHCISRGLSVSIQHGQEFQASGFPDDQMRRGFESYVRSLAVVIHAHHLSEDEVAFPYFQDKFPQAPFDQYAEAHRQIVPIIHAINLALDRFSEDGGRLAEIHQDLSDVDAIWHPHIQTEENVFTPEKVDELVSLADQQMLARQIGEHIQKNAVPDYLTVPFTLFNLEGNEREYVAADMPPMLTQQLVPIVWKEKWAPMSPFLLI